MVGNFRRYSEEMAIQLYSLQNVHSHSESFERDKIFYFNHKHKVYIYEIWFKVIIKNTWIIKSGLKLKYKEKRFSLHIYNFVFKFAITLHDSIFHFENPKSWSVEHDYKPGSNLLEYYRSFANTDSCNNLFFTKKQFRLEYSSSQVLNPK